MAPPTYETFELLIGTRRSRGYRTKIINSPAGEANALCRLDVDDHELQEMLTDIVDGYSDADLLKEFGGYLFSRLFTGKVERLYRESLGRVQGQDKRLRVRLRIESPELAALPWEYLYDEQADEFLALSAHSALMRYIPMEVSKRPSAVTPPLRLLVVISNPIDYEKLDVEQEKERISQPLAELVNQGIVEVQLLERAHLPTVRHTIHRFSPHVFHYIGHSVFDEEKAYVILTDEDEYGHAVDEQTFSQLFDGVDDVRLAVLNGCQSASSSSTQLLSGLAANLLKHKLSAVVAMQYPIADEAALLFSSEFYSSLAAGYPIEAAITEARKALFMDLGGDGQDWGTPVLFLRADEGLLVQKAKTGKRVLQMPPPPEPRHPPDVSHFVGREKELAYYSEQLHQIGFALICGMPGVGKSLLAAKLISQRYGSADAPPDWHQIMKTKKVFWHTFHADEGFAAIIWELGAFMAWHGEYDLWEILNSVQQTGGKLPHTTILLDYFLQMARRMRNQNDTPDDRKGALLLCFDDFQHVEDDPLTALCTERLTTAIVDGDISVMTTSQRVPDFIPLGEVTPLMGLSGDESTALLVKHGLRLPTELLNDLYTLTEGNPELLLLAMVSLKQVNLELVGPQIKEFMLESEDIERYLLTKVDDTLTDEERQVQSSVSVLLGYPGTRRLIEKIAARRPLRRLLASLSERYLLFVIHNHLAREYSQHTILRAFFYDLLSDEERRQMHQRAAAYYEQQEKEQLRAILHYKQAGEYEQVAKLTTLHTWDLIIQGHAALLLRITETIKEEQLEPILWAKLQIAKAELHMQLGNYPQAKKSLHTTLAILKNNDTSSITQLLKVRAYLHLGEILKHQVPAEALKWLHRAQSSLSIDTSTSEGKVSLRKENTHLTSYRAKLHLRLGAVHRLLGDYPAALTAIERGLFLLPEQASQLQLDGLLELSALFIHQGDMKQATLVAGQALALSERLHAHYRMITSLTTLSVAHYYAGDWQRGIAYGEKAVALTERSGSVIQRTRLAVNVGWMSVSNGDDEGAQTLLTEGITLARKHNLKEAEIAAQSTLADLYLRRGQAELAKPLLENAKAQVLKAGLKYQQPEILRHWASLYLSEGKPQASLEAIEQSLVLSRELGNKLEEGMSLRVQADVLLAMQKPLNEVLPCYEQSLACLSEEPYERARTQACWGQVLLEHDDAPRLRGEEEGQALLKEAYQTFKELGAKRDLVILKELGIGD